MLINKKTVRLLTMLLVAVVMMTTVAVAQGIADVAKNFQTEAVAVFSVIVVIGTLFGIVKLVIKQSWLWAILTGIGGFGAAYLISKPELVTEIVANTFKGIVG